MNNSGSITTAHMERRLEEEVARQQQSAMLANEMAMAARMNHQMVGGSGAMVNSNNNGNGGNGNSSNNFGNGNMGDPSGFANGQRQQGLYDNSVDFLNVSDAQSELDRLRCFLSCSF